MNFLSILLESYARLLTSTSSQKLRIGCNFLGFSVERLLPGRSTHKSFLKYEVQFYKFADFYSLFWEIFVRQQYRYRSAAERPLILDCGANIGMSCLFFKWLYPQSDIWCFEPSPESYQLLVSNLNRNNFDCVTHNIALGDCEAEIPFYCDYAGSPTASSLSERNAGHSVPVACKRLSSFINRRIDLLKIDVEGAEWQVIRDLCDSGKIDLVDSMFIEYHHKVLCQKSQLASFLSMLESAKFEYNIDSNILQGFEYHVDSHASRQSHFQDILIYAYRA